MELLWLVLVLVLIFVVEPKLNAAQRRNQEKERRAKIEEIGVITEQDKVKSDLLMMNKEFIKLKDMIISNTTECVLLNARSPSTIYPKPKHINETDALAVPGAKETHWPVSRVLSVNLESIGFKPLKEVDKVRVLFYTLSRYDGFKYEYKYYADYCFEPHQAVQMSVVTDDSYWLEIENAEKKRLEEEKNAGLINLF